MTVDTIYLTGSEDVKRAASQMLAAAETMERAAMSIDAATERMERLMAAFADRLETILTAPKESA